jgi:hypothetical protein
MVWMTVTAIGAVMILTVVPSILAVVVIAPVLHLLARLQSHETNSDPLPRLRHVGEQGQRPRLT